MPATPACPRRHKSHVIRPGHDGHGYSDFHAAEFPISSDDSDHEKLKNMPVPPPMRESFPADKFSNRQQFSNKGERFVKIYTELIVIYYNDFSTNSKIPGNQIIRRH